MSNCLDALLRVSCRNLQDLQQRSGASSQLEAWRVSPRREPPQVRDSVKATVMCPHMCDYGGAARTDRDASIEFRFCDAHTKTEVKGTSRKRRQSAFKEGDAEFNLN